MLPTSMIMYVGIPRLLGMDKSLHRSLVENTIVDGLFCICVAEKFTLSLCQTVIKYLIFPAVISCVITQTKPN